MEVKRPFWLWVFCESDGTPSFARIATLLLLAFVCGWGTSIVLRTGRLPEFGGMALFMTSLYGINKAAASLPGRRDA